MIEQMKKYTFLVYHRGYEQFLNDIRDLGVVHITQKAAGMAEDEKLQSLLEQTENMRRIIRQGASDELVQKRAVLEQNIQNTKREQEQVAVWGTFSKERIAELAASGYTLHYYVCPTKAYQSEWGIVVAEDKTYSYFVVVTKPGDDVPSFGDACQKVQLGDKDAAALQADLDAMNAELDTVNKSIDVFKKEEIPHLEQQLVELQHQIDWQRVTLSTDSLAEGALCLVEGFCPVDKTADLNALLKKEAVYYEVSDPVVEDQTPIKLKNNRFVQLFECLTGMYGWPKYQEFDPTPIMGPFFLLFFALCIGDLGYGLLLILVGYLIYKEKLKIEMFSGMGPIIMALGVGSTIIGYMMGGFFGIDLYAADWFPNAGKAVMFKGLFGEKIAGYDVMMVLAIALGVIHICIAMTVKCLSFTKQKGFAATVADWGWLLLILGSLIVIILGSLTQWGVGTTKWILIGIAIVSAIGIFPMNTPGRSPLVNTGAGLWATYQMATGILGDVLSYIRLYALGLAGGMLGQAFNQLAEMVLGDVPNVFTWVCFILIVTFGHILNLLMACLGAFVHPLRLSFVEYFKNSGYEGSGQLYQPFSLRS